MNIITNKVIALLMVCISVCFGLSDTDKMFVDKEINAMKDNPVNSYVSITRIETKGEAGISFCLDKLISHIPVAVSCGDRFYHLNLLMAIGRFENETITESQYQALKENTDLTNKNMKAALMRVKERTKNFDFNNPQFD